MGFAGLLVAIALFEAFLLTYFLRECGAGKTLVWTALASRWFLSVPLPRAVVVLIALVVFTAAGFAATAFRPRWSRVATGIVLTIGIVIGVTWIYVPPDLGGCSSSDGSER